MNISETLEEMRKRISLGPDGAQVPSYTRTLSLSPGGPYVHPLVYPQQLDSIFDHFIAFKNIRRLRASLFATHYVRHPLTPRARYFAHLQLTLHSPSRDLVSLLKQTTLPLTMTQWGYSDNSECSGLW